MLTSRDVAKEAGVSVATVSRAFNSNSAISEKTRNRILEISDRLGYTPNFAASSLKSKSSGIIGVIFTDPSNIFLSNIINEMESYVNSYGYRFIIMYSNDSIDREAKHLQTLLSLCVDGVLLMPVVSSDALQTKRILKQFKNQGTPVLQCLIDFYKELPTFSINHRYGAYNATKYLLDLGHRNIIYADKLDSGIPDVKFEGYKSAFENAGLAYSKDFMLQIPYSIDATSILAKRITSLEATAIITSYAPLTVSALKAFRELKYKYPADISIISYDDNDWLNLMDITSIAVSAEKVGDQIASLLVNDLMHTEKDSNTFIEVEPALIYRNSVRNLNDKNEQSE
jgi:DNA-binding LacI/PurR family transcriptional regulator